jgi:hypothetical protein
MPVRVMRPGPAAAFLWGLTALWDITALWGVNASSGIASPPPTPQFSAEIVTRDSAGQVVGTAGRLYVANGKVRIETSQTGNAAAFYLVDGAAGTSFFVRPDRHVFMDARRSTPLTQIFVPVDPEHPCKGWQAAAESAAVPAAEGEWHCERTGPPSMVDGRAIVELRVSSPGQESTQRWVDLVLGFPVRFKAADGSVITLEHLQPGSQLAELFALPADFRKLDPRALIERIKHSDVWAGDSASNPSRP